MPKFKILKRFVDCDRKEYSPGDVIIVDNGMKACRMIAYGIIKTKKKPGRKPKVERAVVL